MLNKNEMQTSCQKMLNIVKQALIQIKPNKTVTENPTSKIWFIFELKIMPKVINHPLHTLKYTLSNSEYQEIDKTLP